MTRLFALVPLTVLCALVSTSTAAQDLVISNARIIVGTGATIDRGSIVVRNGRIVSVAVGAPSAPGGADHRREGHDGAGRLHRRAPPHHRRERRALVQGAVSAVKLMGPNTAAFIEKGKELGTLESGKLADIVLVDGDPLDRSTTCST